MRKPAASWIISHGLVLAFAFASDLAAQTWTRLTPPTSPSARRFHTMAYDDSRDRVVLFGGFDTAVLGDTWEYDGTTWTNVTPTNSPPVRRLHAMCYDSARGRIVLHGGQDLSTDLNDTWEYDGTTWYQTAMTSAPPSRSLSAIAYDAARARTVLFGGQDWSSTALGDTWEYDGVQWTQVLPTVSPPPRGRMSFSYDSARGVIVMFSGYDSHGAPGGITGALLSDCWTYDGTSWNAFTGTLPQPNMLGGQAYDRTRGRSIQFGGDGQTLTGGHGGGGGANVLFATWAFDGATFTMVNTFAVNSPPARFAHGMTFDNLRGRLIMFGGYDFQTTFGDTWQWRPAAVPSWTRHGLGCAGINGVPQLDPAGSSMPQLGTQLTMHLNCLPQPGLTALVLGFDLVRWNNQLLPAAVDPTRPQCRLWLGLSNSSILLAVHTGISANVGIAIPALASLQGMVIGAQAVTFDSSLPQGFALSNGGIMQLNQ